MRQKEKVNAREPQCEEDESDGQEDPELYFVVKEASIMDTFDKVGAAEGYLYDIGGFGVDLYFPAILASYF